MVSTCGSNFMVISLAQGQSSFYRACCSTHFNGVFLGWRTISKFLKLGEWNFSFKLYLCHIYSTLFNIYISKVIFILIHILDPFSRRKMFKILLSGIQCESHRVWNLKNVEYEKGEGEMILILLFDVFFRIRSE